MREIQLEDAKASLSAVVDEVMQGKPAVITRHGKRQAVVVSYEEWERLSHVPTFGRLLMAAPLAADDLPEPRHLSPADSRSLSPCISSIPTLFRLQLHPGRHLPRLPNGWMPIPNSLFLSVVTVAEIEDGIAELGGERATHARAGIWPRGLGTVSHLYG